MNVIWRAPDWASLKVIGPDAVTWLNGIVTGPIASVRDGLGAWSSLLNKQGKVQADLQVLPALDGLIVGISGGDVEDVFETLDGYLIMEDAELSKDEETCWVLAVGQGADEEMKTLDLHPHALPWRGERVFAALIHRDALSALKPRVTWASDEQWNELRTRCGWYQFGVDYSNQDNLHAASLERRTVDWQKGCYLGQEVVCMQDMRGKVKKRLAVVRADGDSLPPAGTELFAEDASEQPCGRVVSTALHHAVAKVDVPHDAAGTVLFGGGTRVSVVPLAAGP